MGIVESGGITESARWIFWEFVESRVDSRFCVRDSTQSAESRNGRGRVKFGFVRDSMLYSMIL